MWSAVGGVVVGVDGGPGGLAAVRAAAAEAERRGLGLCIVHATGGRMVPTYGAAATSHRSPTALLAEAAGFAALRHPEVDVATLLATGSPAVALLDASATAALTVVGRRSRDGFPDLLPGSTAAQVATHGRSTVIVVRGKVLTDRPVLAAPDARNPSPGVLSFALHEAALREVPLEVLFGSTPADDELRVGAWDAERLLTEAIADCSDTVAQVRVTTRVRLTPDPARTIVDATPGTSLAVVGSHRRDDLAGVLLGAVAYALVHQAACPVAVVHPDDHPVTG